MSEVLARVRNEVLSRRVDLKRAGGNLLRQVPARLFSLSPRAYATAALSALVAGIAVNALVLQRGRHPAPLFPTAKVAPESAAVGAQKLPPAAPEPAPRPADEPPQPVRDAPTATASIPTPPAASRHVLAKHDAIGDLLQQAKSDEDAHLLQAARAALIKLGYPLKTDAGEPAVRQAIREYESTHGLPLTSDITSRLVRRLGDAARSAAR